MPRTKKGAGSSGKSQGVKDAEQSIKEIKNHIKHLLKNAGKDLRQVRHEVSQLKKAGVVSKRIDARNYQPSRYMLSKLRKNADILSGESIAIKAPKSVRNKYTEKGIFEARGGSLIVPKSYDHERVKIKRGMIEISRPLKSGEESRIILPFKATDMEDVAHKLLADPTLDGLKRGDEMFGVRLFGHRMKQGHGFLDIQELADYILINYHHLFSGRDGQAAFRNLELWKFKNNRSEISDYPENKKQYGPRRQKERDQTDWYYNRKREQAAARKAKMRANEKPEQREKRLEKNRIRAAQWRQRKYFDE